MTSAAARTRSFFKLVPLILLGLIGLMLMWLLILALMIASYSTHTSPLAAEAAIVLGAAVADGKPTPVFEERIRHGIQLYRENRVRQLILTGGIGAGDRLAESEVAMKYCLARGIPLQAIAIETQSQTTEENLIQAASLIRQRQISRVLLVSDPLHERRSITIARDLGLDAHPSPTPSSRYIGWQSRLSFLVRETWFYAGYLLSRLGHRIGLEASAGPGS